MGGACCGRFRGEFLHSEDCIREFEGGGCWGGSARDEKETLQNLLGGKKTFKLYYKRLRGKKARGGVEKEKKVNFDSPEERKRGTLQYSTDGKRLGVRRIVGDGLELAADKLAAGAREKKEIYISRGQGLENLGNRSGPRS